MALAASPPRETMRRVASAGHMNGGMKRVASGVALRRPPSAGNLQTHSRNSGGSELFDALLQAATADQDGALAGPSHGDPPVTSRHYAAAQLGRQRSGRMWSAPGGGQNEVDSLQVGGGAAGRGAPAGLGRAAGLGRGMPPACHPHWQNVPCRHTLTALLRRAPAPARTGGHGRLCRRGGRGGRRGAPWVCAPPHAAPQQREHDP